MSIERKRAPHACDVCKQVPKENKNGRFTCGCGTLWVWRNGVQGTLEERARFNQIGYEWTSIQGGGYYESPNRPRVYLFADDTWELDPHIEAPQSLKEYLDWVEATLAVIGGRN